MKIRHRELAKAGIFGSADSPVIVTEKDLKEIAETFSDIKRAPVQFGHREEAVNPRLASVTSVSYDPATKMLSGGVEEEDALARAVDAGYYPDVSIGAKRRASDGKMYLHHLAYLGQEAPAVKDLIASIKEPLGLAADDGKDVRVFPGAAERQLYLSDSPQIDKPLNNTDRKGAKSIPPEEDISSGGILLAPKNQNQEESVTEEEAARLKAENEKLKEEAKAKDIALSDAAKTRKEAEKEKLQAVMEGRIPKGQQGKVLALCDAFDMQRTIELSDADGSKRNSSAAQILAEVISAIPSPVESGALNLSDAGERAEPVKPDNARRMMGHV